ncbi:MAG: hypothetical protein AB2809_22245 [Candidatus Thiodiazotropha sp.]
MDTPKYFKLPPDDWINPDSDTPDSEQIRIATRLGALKGNIGSGQQFQSASLLDIDWNKALRSVESLIDLSDPQTSVDQFAAHQRYFHKSWGLDDFPTTDNWDDFKTVLSAMFIYDRRKIHGWDNPSAPDDSILLGGITETPTQHPSTELVRGANQENNIDIKLSLIINSDTATSLDDTPVTINPDTDDEEVKTTQILLLVGRGDTLSELRNNRIKTPSDYVDDLFLSDSFKITDQRESATLYHVTLKPDYTLNEDKLLELWLTLEGYQKFWSEAVYSLSEVGFSSWENKVGYSYTLSLTAQRLAKLLPRLNSERLLSDKLKSTADHILNSIPSSSDDENLKSEEIQSIISQYQELIQSVQKTELDHEALFKQARKEGYVITWSENAYKIQEPGVGVRKRPVTRYREDCQTKKVRDGERCHWESLLSLSDTSHIDSIGTWKIDPHDRSFPGEHYRECYPEYKYVRECRQVPYESTENYIAGVLVSVDGIDDLLTAYMKWFASNGINNIYILSQSNSGLVSESGESIIDIMVRLNHSVTLRNKTIIVVPIYSHEPTDEEPVAYQLFARPRPGLTLIQVPELFSLENITYQLKWEGAKVGDLLKSIALAPGEERTITLSTSTTRATVETTSTESTINTEQSSQESFKESFLDDIKNESTKKTSTNWNASASASFGGFGGNVSGGGKRSSSVMNFSRSLAKNAQSRSEENRKAFSLNIKSSLSVSTSQNIEESTTTVIRNPNSGSTLNIRFHNLFNHYKGTFNYGVDQLGWTSGREVIQGSGLLNTLYIERSKLPRLLPDLLQDGFDNILTTEQETALIAAIQLALIQKYQTDYASSGIAKVPTWFKISAKITDDGFVFKSGNIKVPGELSLLSIANRAKFLDFDDTDYSDITPSLIKTANTHISAINELSLSQKNREILISEAWNFIRDGILVKDIVGYQPHDILLGTKAVYAESSPGVSHGTDTYTDHMRYAELFNQYGEAVYLYSKASHIAAADFDVEQSIQSADDSEVISSNTNQIDGQYHLTIEMTEPVDSISKDWTLYYLGHNTGARFELLPDGKVLNLRLDSKPDWWDIAPDGLELGNFHNNGYPRFEIR